MSDVGPVSAQDGQDKSPELPVVDLLHIPGGLTFWSRAFLLAIVLFGLYLLDQVAYVFLDFWLLGSLGFESVFWTNFSMAATLFVIGFAGTVFAVAGPVFVNDVGPNWRRLIIRAGVLIGLIGGYVLADQFLDYLLWFGGGSFQERDPVFDRDIGFFVFSLPAIWITWAAVTVPMVLGLVSALICTTLERPRSEIFGRGFWLTSWLGVIATPFNLLKLAILGVLAAAGVWLSRFDLLWRNNEDSLIFSGAEYVDVTGLFSTLNYYYVTSFVILGVTAAVVFMLYLLRRTTTAPVSSAWRRAMRTAAVAVMVLVAFNVSFRLLVTVRDVVAVVPNEPVIQLAYIKRHIDATLKGYGLDKVETVSFIPYDLSDPFPDAERLLQSATLKNAPLWPGWVSYLEDVIDVQHIDRVMQTDGDTMVYGPVLEIFRQQQKLRTYYDFLDVDTVRYRINGETVMFASAVRELPSYPEPWLYRWGQRMLHYTHGYGLVMVPVSALDIDGGPVYASSAIPARAVWPELQLQNQSVYYGEGGGIFGTDPWTMAYSNARQIKELDYPTEEGRAEVTYPPDVDAGVAIDSWLKRIVIGWTSGAFLDTVLTRLIGLETRVHYYRTPIERAERVAPFLYFDTNIYAVANNGVITWLINAMNTTDRYPYSVIMDLGDKAEERAVVMRPDRWVNWVRDAVKVTVNAYTGKIRFYAISDDPMSKTWASIYPDLFTPGNAMPPSVREHLQYPIHLFHTQFDDIYKRYHMTDPLTFFTMEDLWDDADEVLGPVLDEGEAITFSIEPYQWVAQTDGEVLPASNDGTQFALSMVFTNEQALNLRAIPMAYQDGDDYGRLVVLQVPKGHFYPGPEQADAAIDQDREITQKITWWNRMGAEVIHGHTSTLVIGREVIYVAPLFIRSAQNPISQIKLVLVVFRGHAADGTTLEEALRNAIEGASKASRHLKRRPHPCRPLGKVVRRPARLRSKSKTRRLLKPYAAGKH